MKTFVSITFLILLVTACNNPGKKAESMSGDSSKATMESSSDEANYPYTLDKPYKNWKPGDKKHTQTVLKMLKAWETKNAAECASYFGDSLELALDYYHKVVPHDSLITMLEHSWADFASVNIKMDDWESVISDDKKDEWVTVWYKQTWTDKKGKMDSMAVVDDAKIKDGKIVIFDEKIRHYPTPKK
ncbi:nuclear transport factor 2 family protein [Chitinophaga sp. CF418]|uniref:nuclear transport factor 2 family protein n=1 Tax=Chitinophaga sp. CF418 TaxID=1855287 RepID=UPI0009242BD4|nr:nuclear transport factor 2 family protein [Chitinophaga sp. CF418]SHN12235.1 hypothetical protein SAMN05216311_105293 [Chitinophaga sp. CF418]